MFSTRIFGIPGTHGAAMTGVQGAGVNRTGGGLFVAGLATELHIPKGGILAMGLLSMMFASGMVPARIFGRITIIDEGETPKLHVIEAPMQTAVPIFSPS